MNNPIFHVIKDPVHGTMQFNSAENLWIKPFIDSPHFQRLRHIKQLGMGDYIFPGAVHTRLNHCLGCCYIAGQISQKIGLPEEERQLVMIACLLHDIGHGPFSHTFEDLFLNKLIRHEAWTPLFLADYCNEEFFTRYNDINPHFPLNEEKFLIIQKMIMHQASAKPLLADIVSSQLDADRLDYLLRDSHFCGVRYGEFDFRWMLHCLAIVTVKNNERLGITYKGIGVVEHYLMARRLMTRNIYHHPKKLALEFLLIKLLANLAENLNDYPAFAELKPTPFGQFLINVNIFNQQAATSSDLSQLEQEFLQNNYATYKNLCDYDVLSLLRLLASYTSNHPAIEIAKRIQQREIPKIFRLNPIQITNAEAVITEFKKQNTNIQDWQFSLIKTPHQAYSGEDDPIWVAHSSGCTQPINQFSLILEAMSDQLEHAAFLCVDTTMSKDKAIQKIIDQLIL